MFTYRPGICSGLSLSRLALAVCTALACATARADSGADVVGEVTTVIGQGAILGASGEPQPAVRGQRIRIGDRVETAIGGHVHIRFVDGGLVSVRPLSRLQVEAYRNGDASTLAAIKFKLEEGVVRSVTGQWGEAHRERFRLNTPVAAIGVKGTDFVVKVGQGGDTFASIISGAIVMAPLEGSCAVSLGPCAGDRSAVLSADMPGKMLEFIQQNGHGAPRLVPAVDLQARPGGPALPMIAAADAASKVPASDTMAAGSLNDSPLPAGPRDRPLVWMHNARGWNVPENSISQRYDEALAAGRKIVVGNLFINLYRDETILKSFQPLVTSASFGLASASATYAQPIAGGRPVENVQISNASLNVDFAAASYTTQLTLSSPSLGQNVFSAGGKVASNGVILANGAGQSLAGAFSHDGLQAGYLFSKTLPTGTVSGLTLWGR